MVKPIGDTFTETARSYVFRECDLFLVTRTIYTDSGKFDRPFLLSRFALTRGIYNGR